MITQSIKLTFFRLSLSSALIATCQLAFATAGSTDYGYGEISKSMGGTGVAMPLDSLTPATNPAGIAFLEEQADFGLSIFSPRRGYEASNVSPQPFGVAPGTHWSDNNYFFIPDMGYTRPFAEQRGAFGISLYGNGGMNTDYSKDFSGSTFGPSSSVYGGGSAGINLQQMFLNIALAWKLTPQFSLGASLLPAVQTLSAKGVSVAAPFSADPNNLSDNGVDYSYGLGFKFGALLKPSPFFSAGASYQPKISMSAFDDYKGFLPDQGTLDIPATGTVGISISPEKRLSFNADAQRIWYENVNAYGNNLNSCTLGGAPCLGVDNGAGFAWKNTNVYKFGAQWVANEKWTWRAGYAYVTQPISSSSAQDIINVLAPAVVQNHYTVGLSYDFNQRFALNPYFLYAPKSTSSGQNQFNPNQQVDLFMRQYAVGASLSWKIGA